MQFGFIGLGVTAANLTANILKAGHKLTERAGMKIAVDAERLQGSLKAGNV